MATTHSYLLREEGQQKRRRKEEGEGRSKNPKPQIVSENLNRWIWGAKMVGSRRETSGCMLKVGVIIQIVINPLNAYHGHWAQVSLNPYHYPILLCPLYR